MAAAGLLWLTLLAVPADTLVVGLLSDPVSLDPQRATDLVTAAVVANVCEPLVRFRDDGSRPRAALALTWATTDNRTWTLTLREGVRFHDGTPFDADAVVINMKHLQQRGIFRGKAERVGPHVVAIRLARPNAALLATLSQPIFSMQSPRQLVRKQPHAVGTGPFRLESARPGRYEFRANPDYWGGAPRLSRLLFKRFPDHDALITALLEGEADVTAAVGLEQVERLRRTRGVSLDAHAGLNVSFLSINNEHPPFDRTRVRQAVAWSIDRQALIAEILKGFADPARNPLPPALLGYRTQTRALFFDPDRARRLLAAAGLQDGFETTLLVPDTTRPYLPAPLRLAKRIRDDLMQVGIKLHIERVKRWADYIERARQGDYDLALLGWQADTLDPNDFLSTLLGTPAIGATNRSRYSSPPMDSLLRRGRRATGIRERRGIYHQAQALFQKDMPWVPLYHASVFTARRAAVHGLATAPGGLLLYYGRAWKEE